MGVIKLFSSCSDDSCREQAGGRVSGHPRHKREIEQEMKIVGNPNPRNFQIVRCESVGHFVVALVKYPECLNFEGQKVLVFEDIFVETIKNLDSIDPHFCDSDHPSPVARFVPTRKGWDYAIQFCKTQRKERRKRKWEYRPSTLAVKVVGGSEVSRIPDGTPVAVPVLVDSLCLPSARGESRNSNKSSEILPTILSGVT